MKNKIKALKYAIGMINSFFGFDLLITTLKFKRVDPELEIINMYLEITSPKIRRMP